MTYFKGSIVLFESQLNGRKPKEITAIVVYFHLLRKVKLPTYICDFA